MLVVISPAKNLDYETPLPTQLSSNADFLAQSKQLIEQLQPLAPHEISQLMGISDKLGLLNYDRFQTWQLPFDKVTSRPALLAFKGDVYVGLGAYHFDDADFEFAQSQLRILSGLYGLLKPLDRILPYRLEMGTKFANTVGKDLYAFWGHRITDAVNAQLQKVGGPLINLASNEYFKSVKVKQLQAPVITPVFKDKKNDTYKIISFFAKKARGRMSAYIIKNRLSDVEQLKAFDWDGYNYNPAMSNESEWVFTRDQQPQ